MSENTASGDPGSAEGQNPYAVLRNRDLRLYLVGRLVATLGQQMFTMAVGWELYERTGSALALGLVGLTQMVPMLLFTLPAGHLADNYNRKRIIVVSGIAMALASLGLAFISALAAPVIWMYFCLLIGGAARTFMWAASAAFLPHLVERKVLSKAVAWNASSTQVSAIIGPTAAGAFIGLTGHHAAPVYALNAVAALASCLLIGMIRREHTVAVKDSMNIKALLTGFQFVLSKRIILGIITLDMFAVLLGGATVLLPIYAKDILHTGPTGLGLLQTAMPLGAVLCTFILSRRLPMQKAGRALLWAVAGFGMATVAFGFSKWFWLSFLLLFLCGSMDNISVVVRHTLVQLLTPDDKRGRVSAVNNLFIGTSNEMGGFESGSVAYLFGAAMGNTIATGAIVSVVSGGIGTILVVAAIAFYWPEIRTYGRLDG